MLRDSLGYKGVISTDWGLVTDNPAKKASAWGVEELSAKERVKKILDAGVDMLGGESCADLVVELVKEGSITEERLDASVRRILHDKFVIGLFDDPYRNEENLKVFENETFKEKGREAQRKSLVLLKNDENILPLSPEHKSICPRHGHQRVRGICHYSRNPRRGRRNYLEIRNTILLPLRTRIIFWKKSFIKEDWIFRKMKKLQCSI